MKIALDPYMFRTTPLAELPGLVADLGYEYLELSPRDDFIPFFKHPRVDTAGIRAFRKALDAAGVEVSSLLPLFRWSGPDEDERQTAVRYWKRSIEIAAELGGPRTRQSPRASSGSRSRSCCRCSSATASASRSSRTRTTSSRMGSPR
jgi:sugar phosphate isomerase/epimerase